MTRKAGGRPSGLSPADAAYIAGFAPRKIPADVWAEIGPFVRAAVSDCMGRTARQTQLMLVMTTQLAAWCHGQGLSLSHETVFDRDTVALYIDHGCEQHQQKTRGSTRSLLLGMGRLLVPDAYPQRLPRLAKGSAQPPYTLQEQAALRSWARGANTPYRREQSALLLALGFGAGLQRADVAELLVKHVTIDQEGVLINVVGGAHPRVVPVLQDWEEALVDAVFSGRDPDEHLLLPRAKSRNVNLVNTQKVYGAGAPTTIRMRATWLVTHLTAGVPTRALLDAAGIKNFQIFHRYTQFLTNPEPVMARRALRGRA